MGITTREYGPYAKGSRLTTEEMDENFNYLRNLALSSSGPTGPQGIQGPQGTAGASVTILGSYADLAAFNAGAGSLPGTNLGDAWILLSDGSLMSWNGTIWFDAGDIQGPPGSQGPIGPAGAQANLLAVPSDIIPDTDNYYSIGSTGNRWRSIYMGPGTIYITDTVLGTDAGLTVTDGVLLINGANQLEVGQLKFVDNTIESSTGSIDIQIGLTESSGDLLLNRDTELASGKSLTLGTGTTGSAPLRMIAGTNLSSSTAGAFEYDGKTFFATPIINHRGLLEAKQIYYNTAQVALANNTVQKSIFGLTNGVAVSYATRYRFKIVFTARATADNINLFFALAGTATYYRCTYHATVGKGTYGPGMMPVTVVEVTGLTDGQVKNTINISQGGLGGTYFQTTVEGIVDTQYSGYINPVLALGPAPGTGSFIAEYSYMEIYPIGPASSGNTDIIIGNWS